jgi:hypothetical protein
VAVVPESIVSRELTALENRQTISELTLRVKDYADLSTLHLHNIEALSEMFHVHPHAIKRTKK